MQFLQEFQENSSFSIKVVSKAKNKNKILVSTTSYKNRVDLKSYFIMPHFEEKGVYCFANDGLLVSGSVDEMVFADYVETILHKYF